MLHADDGLEPVEMSDGERSAWLRYEEIESWGRRMIDYMYADAEAAQDDERDERNPHADPKCPYCHGSGVVYDMVDYGSTVVSMPSTCDCVEVEDVDA